MFQVQNKNLEGLRPICIKTPEMLKGKKVIVRCDFNVPIGEDGKILNSMRIKKSFKTINYLKNSGAKIILLSHLGRDPKDSLEPVYKFLKQKYEISFCHDFCFPDCRKEIDKLKNGEMILFENLRSWKEEELGDESFSKILSSLGELYVNEAFSVAHRDHASVTGIPKFIPSYIGFQFKEELNNLTKVFDPEHPFSVLIGGAKFQTKMKLIKVLKDKADFIFVGGALSNDIYRANGLEVGMSTVSDMNLDEIKKLVNSDKIFSPIDVLVIDEKGKKKIKSPDNINAGEKIMDGGPKTYKFIKDKIKNDKLIVWNGPFGFYEKGFDYLTNKIAKEVAKNPAFSIVGGGDTLTEIEKLDNHDEYGFISVGGGAMLEFIANGTLIGIDAIKNSSL